MSTTAVSAGQIMDRVARLMNDPNKTDYTYTVMIPYLNMAIEELSELLEESNSSPTNQTSTSVIVPTDANAIVPAEVVFGTCPHYPDDLTEIQEVSERLAGTHDSFIPMTRKEFIQETTRTDALRAWYWEDQWIKFNPSGASTPREVQLKYVRQGVPYIASEATIITMINSRAYLAYKTAAFCARFIGENESRADVLDDQANKAVERVEAISNKGRQQIMTRHRPFRAAFKARGGYARY